jgi:hypothetical protein
VDVDIPTAASALILAGGAIGGVLFRRVQKRALGVLGSLAETVGDIADLLAEITKAGEDGKLTDGEWASIHTKAKEIRDDLLTLKGMLV